MSFEHVSDFDRVDNEHYPTPQLEISIGANYVPARSSIWEPACGDGRISDYMRKLGHYTFSTDVVDYGYEHQQATKSFYDFDHIPTGFGDDEVTIFTNPPYGDHIATFARHALSMAAERTAKGHKTNVVLLYRSTWDTAVRRIDMASKLDLKVNLTWRTQWFEGSTVSGKHSYAWYCWYAGGRGENRQVYIKKPR